jgi:hypothetical protein
VDWVPILGALGIGGVGGAIITQIMTNARNRNARHVAHRKQQLEQFYGPLLAAHKEIRARSELRLKLQTALDNAHMGGMVSAGPGRTEEASDRHTAAIVANVQDENETFRDVLMPRYLEMVSTFRDKMWLAEPKTREYFNQLVEFVDVWEKYSRSSCLDQ